MRHPGPRTVAAGALQSSSVTPKVNLAAVTRRSVLDAVAEFDALGQAEFLRRRGFKMARNYRLVHGGRFYDSKAIAGVAHGYATGVFSDNTGFSGGIATVAECLTRLGFVVDHGGKNARGGLLWELESNTRVFSRDGRGAAYKYVVLLWAVVRGSASADPARYSAVRKELAELLAPFAVAGSRPSPVDPWVALRHSEWWTLRWPEELDARAATHQQARSLAVSEDVAGGLSPQVRRLLKDDAWRVEATAVLLSNIGRLTDAPSAAALGERLAAHDQNLETCREPCRKSLSDTPR